MKTHNKKSLGIKVAVPLLLLLSGSQISGQDYKQEDTIKITGTRESAFHKKRGIRMTTLAFGGNAVNFTRVNDQFTVMTGGRGSATFNDRFTIGGGGWGMTKGVGAGSPSEGKYNFIRMGYGGIDFGYLFVAGEKFDLGSRLLIAGGAVCKETVPASDDKSFKVFPVLEPSIYYQVSISKSFRFEMGACYRFIRGTKLSYVSDRELSGISCYIGFLIRTAG